jgi:hypothetical protein
MTAELATYPADVRIASLGEWSNLSRDPNGIPNNYLYINGLNAVDVSAYGGQQIMLKFYAQTDDSSYTTFRIDDVSLTATVPGVPDLTPYQPANWNNKIPIGTSRLGLNDAHSYSGSYFDNQTLYLNWASYNQGNAAAGAYMVHVEVTGTGGGSWNWSIPSTAIGQWYASTLDQAVGPLVAGSHTFKVWVDYNGTVDEGSNEGNNYYERTITVSAQETISAPGTITGEANPFQNVLYSYSVGAATSSLGHPVEYSFNWGDGTSSSFSTSTSASHAWSTTGQKNIVVTARCQTHTGISNNNSPGKSVTVLPQPPGPVAIFSGDLQPVTGKLSTYNGTLSTGTSLTYAWTLSDGRTSTASAPSFAFNSPGTYWISLTVTDSIGRTSTASATLYVQAANNGSTPGQPVGADPVVLSAGNYVQERVDLKLPGNGFPFEFKRFYNSKFGDQTGLPLGYGWTHSYNERIKDTGTNVLAIRGNGSTWTFFRSGGSYTNEPGVFDLLTTNSAAGGWLLTDKNQMVKRFDTAGRLISITDKNGNMVSNIYVRRCAAANPRHGGPDNSSEHQLLWLHFGHYRSNRAHRAFPIRHADEPRRSGGRKWSNQSFFLRPHVPPDDGCVRRQRNALRPHRV